jgi:subtilisin family serine protease
MIRFDAIRRMKWRPVLLALLAAGPLLICCDGVAQSMMRGPSMNMSSRAPSMGRGPSSYGGRGPSSYGGRGSSSYGGRGYSGRGGFGIGGVIGMGGVIGVMGDNVRIRPDCTAASRDADGDCTGRTVTSVDRTARKGNNNSNNNNNNNKGKDKGNANRGTTVSASVDSRTIPNEIVAEIDGALSEAQADALARRHGLRRVDSQSFPLIGSTIGLFRIADGKTVEAASREFASDRGVRSVQPNFRYLLQDQDAGLSEGDPAQYALAKLRLPQAHTLAHGVNITIAVIDSGIDLKHPEFAGITITPFDALGSKEGPHFHGTGVAGAIVAHGRLMGSAPAAQLLAIRAFGVSGKSAESTSYVILKAMDFAAAHGARIVNMSFAGPKDAMVERGLAALAARNILMVAAAGNAGPKSPPLYPGADSNVIAVSATDAQDKIFEASNRGAYVAIAAPGVDIFLPVPDNKYEMRSGTSFSAAYISGLAALMLERNPGLKPEEVRAILTKTARDLGPPGPDDQFGAGEADAFAAVTAVSAPSVPVAEISEKPVAIDVPNTAEASAAPTRSLPAAAMAADAPAGGETQPELNQTKPGTP